MLPSPPMFPLSLCALTTAVALTMVGCGGAGPATQTTGPDAPPTTPSEPKDHFLVHPEWVWSDGSKTIQGTAFYMQLDGAVYAMTCTHYLSRKAEPALVSANLISLKGEKLDEVDSSRDGLGSGGIDGQIADFRDDDLLLAVSRLPKGYIALELDGRKPLPIGEKVWLPYETATGSVSRRTGIISSWDPGYVEVRLDEELQVTSHSGTPVISEKTGKVVGLLSRSDSKTQKKLWLAPVWGWAITGPSDETQALRDVHAEAAPPAHAPSAIQLQLNLPAKVSWQQLEVTMAKATPQVEQSQVQVLEQPEGGARLQFVQSGQKVHALDFAADGTLKAVKLTPDLLATMERAAKKKNMDEAQRQAYRARVDKLLAGDLEHVFSWANMDLPLGQDLQQKQPLNVAGETRERIISLRANRLFPCLRAGVEHTCVELAMRQSLPDTTGTPGASRAESLFLTELEVDTMMPHKFSKEIFSDEGGRTIHKLTFLSFRH